MKEEGNLAPMDRRKWGWEKETTQKVFQKCIVLETVRAGGALAPVVGSHCGQELYLWGPGPALVLVPF